jgi:hypothetical protein
VVPNPSQHTLHLTREAGATGAASLTLQDLQGRTVLATTLPASQLARDLDLTAVAPGVYVLRIKLPQGSFSQKITVQ